MTILGIFVLVGIALAVVIAGLTAYAKSKVKAKIKLKTIIPFVCLILVYLILLLIFIPDIKSEIKERAKENKIAVEAENTKVSSSEEGIITSIPTGANTPSPTITASPAVKSTPTATPSSSSIATATVSPGFDENVYYIQVYDVVQDEIYTDDPKPPYGSHLPYGYLYKGEISLEIAGVSENKEELFDIEFTYLENGIYEFTVPSPCYAIRFTSDINTYTSFYIYQSLYDRFINEPFSYYNPLKIYLYLHSDYIDITWTKGSIENCRTMQNVDYMNNDFYEEFSFSVFTSRFNSRPIVSFKLLPGEYLVTYLDGSQRVIDFDKSGKYDFSYDGN